MGESQHAIGDGVSILQTANEYMGCTQRETTQRLKACHVWCHGLFHRLRQQRHSVGDASGQGIGCTYGCRHPWDEDTKVRFPTDANGTFEQRQRSAEVALANSQETDSFTGYDNTATVFNRLGNPQPFVPDSTPLGERTELGMALGQAGTTAHGG